MVPSQNVAPLYAPIMHIGGLEKNFAENPDFPANEKIDGCAFVCKYLGVGCGPNEVPYHTFIPYKYWLLTLHQKKVMAFQNKVSKWRFPGGLPSKA